MKTRAKKVHMTGFTIVELLIIVAVIAILASITIVSYNSVTQNSRTQSISADLTTVSSELSEYKANNGAFPSSAIFTSTIEKTNTSGQTVYTYTLNAATGNYCLRAVAYGKSLYLTGTNSKVKEGATCPVGSY